MSAAPAAQVASAPKSSPAALVRAWDSAYGSGHWLRACTDLTVTLADRLGHGFLAAGAYDRCADAFIGAVHEVPRAAKAIESTVASGTIVATTRHGRTARVSVRYVVSPPVSPTRFPPRETYTVIAHDGGWLISVGSAF